MLKKPTKRFLALILWLSLLPNPVYGMAALITEVLVVAGVVAEHWEEIETAFSTALNLYLLTRDLEDQRVSSLFYQRMGEIAQNVILNNRSEPIQKALNTSEVLDSPAIDSVTDVGSQTVSTISSAATTTKTEVLENKITPKQAAQIVQKLSSSLHQKELSLKKTEPISSAPSISLAKPYAVTNIPGGIRVEFENGVWASATTDQPGPARMFGEQRIHNWNQVVEQTKARMETDQDFRREVAARLNFYIGTLINANSFDYAQRIEGRLRLAQLRNVDLPEPYRMYFNLSIDKLIRHYFNADGTLRLAKRDSTTSDIILNCLQGSGIKPTAACYRAPELTTQADLAPAESWFLPHTDELVHKIRVNPLNERFSRIIQKCRAYDFDKAKALIKQEPNDPVIMWNIHDHYYQKYRAAIFDSHGIYRVGLEDPLYTTLSKKDKREIYRHKKLKKRFNETLLTRYSIKDTMHTKWNISPDAPASVQSALYQIMGNDNAGLINIRSLIDRAHKVTSNYDSPDNSEIIRTLFKPNGIFKDFAHYPRAQTLHIPSKILSKEHHATRRMLNHLLCQEHAYPGTARAEKATQAIDYMQTYFATDNAQLQEAYESFFKTIYQGLSTNTSTILEALPNLATTYSDAQQMETHKRIIKLATEYINAIQNKTLTQSQTAYASQFLSTIQNAHTHNQAGNAQAADLILQKALHLPQEKLLDYHLPTIIDQIKECSSTPTEARPQSQIPVPAPDLVGQQKPYELGPDLIGGQVKDATVYGGVLRGLSQIKDLGPDLIGYEKTPEEEWQCNWSKQKKIPDLEGKSAEEGTEESGEQQASSTEDDVDDDYDIDDDEDFDLDEDEDYEIDDEEEATETKAQADSEPEVQTEAELLDKTRTELVETLEYILQHAKPGDTTSGRTKQYEKSGGYNEAVEDFEQLKPTNIQDIDKGKIGELIDGRDINVRNDSSDQRPTLEIINKKNDRRIKIRYGEKE